MTGMPAHGIAIIYTSRRFYTFMRRTTISHFSFLISHSIEAFKRNHGAPRPRGSPRTLNPCPLSYPLDSYQPPISIPKQHTKKNRLTDGSLPCMIIATQYPMR